MDRDKLASRRVPSRRHGSYGIDAPFWPALFAVMIVANLANAVWSRSVWAYFPVLFLLACEGSFLYATLRGKFAVWTELLEQLRLQGDERILDMGCGRGAVLLLAAQHLTTGKAVGIDLWRTADQSGNRIESTRRNAIAEGVADRIELHTADMRAIPFDDNCFDFVLSSLAIHNIHGSAGRETAIDEAVRVLRPGGRLVIADISATGQYVRRLAQGRMGDIARRNLGWRFWWGGPWLPTHLIVATKPLPAQ